MVGEIVVVLVVALMAFGLGALIVRGAGERKRKRLVDAMLSAASSGDTALLRETIDRSGSVNVQAAQGNTALHYAYYTGQREAIENLRAFGADQNLRNNEGLTPADMATLAEAENLLRQGVYYLHPDGTWWNANEGYRIYHRLQKLPSRIFNPAVVRQVLRPERRRELLILAIKVGQPGSQEKLAEALTGFGNKSMAEDYLNCGSEYLYKAAERWARDHNHRIFSRFGGVHVTWGRF